MTRSLLHFEQGVPIEDLSLRREHKDRLTRVKHVYWQWMKNPFLDTFALFKQLCKGKYANLQSEWHAAEKDNWLFEFVVQNVTPPTRKVSEARVRAAANHVIAMGMATDNGRDIVEGSKLLIKVDHLDQPESEQMDMAKAAFLPPVVTTNAHEVDETKVNMDDKQSLAIMDKYNAYVDEKRKMIDDRVAVMEAASEVNSEE